MEISAVDDVKCAVVGKELMYWRVSVRLVQVKMEREQYQSEIRDLQDQLSEMHDELDSAKFTADNEEKETLIMVSR